MYHGRNDVLQTRFADLIGEEDKLIKPADTVSTLVREWRKSGLVEVFNRNTYDGRCDLHRLRKDQNIIRITANGEDYARSLYERGWPSTSFPVQDLELSDEARALLKFLDTRRNPTSFMIDTEELHRSRHVVPRLLNMDWWKFDPSVVLAELVNTGFIELDVRPGMLQMLHDGMDKARQLEMEFPRSKILEILQERFPFIFCSGSRKTES